MHIRFRVEWKIIIDHMGDSLYVQPSRGNIRRYQNVERSLFELFDTSLTLRLGDLSIDGNCRVAELLKALGQLDGGHSGLHKDDSTVRGFCFQNTMQCFELSFRFG